MTSDEAQLRCFAGACSEPARAWNWNRITGGLYCDGCRERAEPYCDQQLRGGPMYPLTRPYGLSDEGSPYVVGTVRVRVAGQTAPVIATEAGRLDPLSLPASLRAGRLNRAARRARKGGK